MPLVHGSARANPTCKENRAQRGRAKCNARARELSLQRALHRLHPVALDDVADLHVLVMLEGHAAFLSGHHLAHIVLEALELGKLAPCTTTLSRMRRTLAPRSTTPSVTRQPATLPTLETLKISRMVALPSIVSRTLGASKPDIAFLTS